MTDAPLRQAKPAVRVLPRVALSNEVADKITDLIYQAKGTYRNPEQTDLDVVLMVGRIPTHMSQYISERVFEIALPEFRSDARRLRRQIAALVDLLPSSSESVLFRHLRSLYCFDDPNADDNEFSDSPEREKQWRAILAPEIIRPALADLQGLLDRLDATIPRNRARADAKNYFVRELAGEWKSLGLRLGNSRATNTVGGGDDAEAGDQQGYFAKFVRQVVASLPAPWSKSPHNKIDTAIRRVIEDDRQRGA